TRRDPNGGLDALLQDRSRAGVYLELGTLGRSIADLEALGAMASDQDLATLQLERTELVRILQLIAIGEPNLSVREGSDLYDTLLQRTKRQRFAAWRAAEKALRFIVAPEYFIKRPPFNPNGDPSWQATPWRADIQVRQRWEELLASRIEQDS